MNREHDSLAAFLHTLVFVHTDADLGRVRARKRKGILLACMIAFLLFLVFIMKISFNAVPHLQSRDWGSLVGDICLSVLVLSLLFMILRALKSDQQPSSLPEKVLDLRRRLKDEKLIPPVTEQPQLLEAEELAMLPKRLGPIRRVKKLSMLLVGVSLFCLYIGFILDALVAALLPTMWDPATPGFWAVFALDILRFFLVMFAALLVVLTVRLLRASRVTVHEWGLHCAWPHLFKGYSVPLAWPEITGFYEIADQCFQNEYGEAYILDSPASTFFWFLREHSTPAERQVCTFLSRLIVTRTGLPLHDMTGAFEQLPRLVLEPEERSRVFVRGQHAES